MRKSLLYQLKIFISSTIIDLQDERSAIEEVIRSLYLNAFRSECFIAYPETPKQLCLRKASECDIFIGVYKEKYGTIPTEENPYCKSIPEMEYDVAMERNKPMLLFQARSGNPDPKLEEFLRKVENFTNGRFRKKYNNIDDLKYNLLISLIFQIFRLDVILTQNQSHSLESLVKEEMSYARFLREFCKYVDFKGFPSFDKIVNTDLNDLYVYPKLLHISDISTDDNPDISLYETDEISERQIEEFELNLHYPISATIRKEYDFLQRETTKKDLKLAEMIRRYSKIVILGGPGLGKTSLLHTHVLTILKDQGGILFPILINIKDFSLACSSSIYATVLSYLKLRYVNLGFSENFMKQHLESGSCVIMFDGLDEVFEIHQRKLISKKIEEFTSLYGDRNVVIVTSRLGPYKDARLSGFEHFKLSKFSIDQIDAFISEWCKVIKANYVNDGGIDTYRHFLKKRILNDTNIRDLARTPLFLMILCLLSLDNTFPSNRKDLFETYLEVVVNTWDQNKVLQTATKDYEIVKSEMMGILKELAFWFYTENRLKASYYEIMRYLKQLFLHRDNIQNLDDFVENLLKTISERTGIILKSGLNEYTFIHTSFQDYLVALKLSEFEISQLNQLPKKFISSRNYEIIPLLGAILSQQSIEKSSNYIKYVLSTRNEFENFIHYNLTQAIRCLIEGTIIKPEVKEQILKEILIVIKNIDGYNFKNVDESIANLLLTSYSSDIMKIMNNICDYHPISVLNILFWFDADLAKFETILKKCYNNLVNSNLVYLVYFIRHRLQKRDNFAMRLAKDLLLSDAFKFHGSSQNKFELLERLIGPLVLNASSNPEAKEIVKNIVEKWKDIRPELAQITVKFIYILDGELYNHFRTIIEDDEQLRSIIEDYRQKREQFTSSFDGFNRLMSHILNEMRNDHEQCPEGCKIVKTIVSELGSSPLTKLMHIALDLVDKNNQYCYDIVELLQSFVKNGRSGVIGPVSELLEIPPSVPPSTQPKNLSNVFGFWPPFELSSSIFSQIYWDDWPSRDLKRLTQNQKLILKLIDCAAELNPEISGRPDVLETLDPESFNNLKPLIEDKNQFPLFRRNALYLFSIKEQENSKEYTLRFLHDKELLPVVFEILMKYDEIDRLIDLLLVNDLPTEIKKSMFLEVLRSR